MCELTVVLEGEKVFEDAVYVKVVDGGVLLKDVIGRPKKFENCYVEEVNIGKELLILKKNNKKIVIHAISDVLGVPHISREDDGYLRITDQILNRGEIKRKKLPRTYIEYLRKLRGEKGKFKLRRYLRKGEI